MKLQQLLSTRDQDVTAATDWISRGENQDSALMLLTIAADQQKATEMPPELWSVLVNLARIGLREVIITRQTREEA